MRHQWIAPLVFAFGILGHPSCKPPSKSDSLTKTPAQANKNYGGLLSFEIPYAPVGAPESKAFWDSLASPTSLGGLLSQKPSTTSADGTVLFANPNDQKMVYALIASYVKGTQTWLKTRCFEINTSEAAAEGKLVWEKYAKSAATPVSTAPQSDALCRFKALGNSATAWATSTTEIAPELLTMYPLAMAPLDFYTANPKSMKIERIPFKSGANASPLAVFLVSVTLAHLLPPSQEKGQATYYMSGGEASIDPNKLEPGTYQFYIAGNAVIPKNTNSLSPGFAVPIMFIKDEKKYTFEELLKATNTPFYDFGLLVLERWGSQLPYLSLATTKENATKWVNPENRSAFASFNKVTQANDARLGTYQPLDETLSPQEIQSKVYHLPIGSYTFIANALPTQVPAKNTHGVVFQINVPTENNTTPAQKLKDWYLNKNQLWFSIGNRHIAEKDNRRDQLPAGTYEKLKTYVTAHLNKTAGACNPTDLESLQWFSDGFFTTIQMALGPSVYNGKTATGPQFQEAYLAVRNSPLLALVDGCPQP